MTLKRKKGKKLLNTAQRWSLSKIIRVWETKAIRISRLLYVPKVSGLEEESHQEWVTKGMWCLRTTSLSIWTVRLLVCTPAPIYWSLMTTWLLRVDQGSTRSLQSVKCTLFLGDSCSSSQQPPKAYNLRKILWVIQQKRIVEKLTSLVCTIHHQESLGACGLQDVVLNHLNYLLPQTVTALKMPSWSCEELSSAPISWLKAALTLPLECHLYRILHMFVSWSLLQRRLGSRLALLSTVPCN